MDKEQRERKERIDEAIRYEKNYFEKLQRAEAKKRTRRRLLILGAIVLLAAAVLLVGCGKSAEENKTLKAIDGMVYSFIVGKVEGNDDLLAAVLTEEAKGILQEGRHAYPGAAEVMAERYEITRWTNEYENGAVYYKVRFFRPSTGKTNIYNVLVIQTEEGWRIADNSSTDSVVMALGMKEEKGKVIHKWAE